MAAVAAVIEAGPRTGLVCLLRAVRSVDAGQVASPDGLASRVEGGFILAPSRRLKEQVRFDRTRIPSEDRASHPILTFSQVPPARPGRGDQAKQVLGAGNPPGGRGPADSDRSGDGPSPQEPDGARRRPFTTGRKRPGARACDPEGSRHGPRGRGPA